ncbi:unnamed protein product [Anisakis simplex]|uniref:H15 domain-containing protein n=1 Tax=Anisakis simplex TaxID=6269 RepID=A0A0M3K760_ANISI|nr:unnamed protein product [Anisakis simplex]
MSSPQASPKKVTKPKVTKPATHPPYAAMVKAAIGAMKEKKGSSRAAILKYILQHFKLDDNITKVNAHLRIALKSGVKSGHLKQTKGTGASGSFRLADKALKAPKKPAAPKVKKPKSPKKTAVKKVVKKATGTKKVSEEKKPKATVKKAKSASPKKAKPVKKPAAAKPKKVKSPKKAKAPKAKVAAKKA